MRQRHPNAYEKCSISTVFAHINNFFLKDDSGPTKTLRRVALGCKPIPASLTIFPWLWKPLGNIDCIYAIKLLNFLKTNFRTNLLQTDKFYSTKYISTLFYPFQVVHLLSQFSKRTLVLPIIAF